MEQIRYGSATTMRAVRGAIQRSQVEDRPANGPREGRRARAPSSISDHLRISQFPARWVTAPVSNRNSRIPSRPGRLTNPVILRRRVADVAGDHVRRS